MTDGIKWIILVAAAILIIGMVIALDITQYIDLGVVRDAITTIVSYAGDAFDFGRGLINNLLSPWARVALSGLLYWILGKEFILWTIKVSTWVYHFIFK